MIMRKIRLLEYKIHFNYNLKTQKMYLMKSSIWAI